MLNKDEQNLKSYVRNISSVTFQEMNMLTTTRQGLICAEIWPLYVLRHSPQD